MIRFVCGMLLAIDFGTSKFGMPQTPSNRNLGFFEVASWFSEDIAVSFAVVPVTFVWIGAFSETVGGFFWLWGSKQE